LASAPAFAAPVTIGSGVGTPLQQVLDNVTVGGHSSINVNTDQTSLGHVTVDASGGSFNQVIGRFGPRNDNDAFGIFDASNPNNRVALFAGNAEDGYTSALQINQNGAVTVSVRDANEDLITTRSANFASGNDVGFYLDTKGANGTFYSIPGLNSDAQDHMLAFQGNNHDTLQIGDSAPGLFTSDEYILAWEDTAFPGSDGDYNDFVSIIESVSPIAPTPAAVPEPAVIGIFGAGLLGIAALMGIRRRYS
jgi:hypothetical protein